MLGEFRNQKKSNAKQKIASTSLKFRQTTNDKMLKTYQDSMDKRQTESW
jgi:hypothetical protein